MAVVVHLVGHDQLDEVRRGVPSRNEPLRIVQKVVAEIFRNHPATIAKDAQAGPFEVEADARPASFHEVLTIRRGNCVRFEPKFESRVTVSTAATRCRSEAVVKLGPETVTFSCRLRGIRRIAVGTDRRRRRVTREFVSTGDLGRRSCNRNERDCALHRGSTRVAEDQIVGSGVRRRGVFPNAVGPVIGAGIKVQLSAGCEGDGSTHLSCARDQEIPQSGVIREPTEGVTTDVAEEGRFRRIDGEIEVVSVGTVHRTAKLHAASPVLGHGYVIRKKNEPLQSHITFRIRRNVRADFNPAGVEIDSEQLPGGS